MTNMDEEIDLTNSCRACQSMTQEGDCTYLFTDSNYGAIDLSTTGALYEELLGIEISLASWEVYPRYVCNNCELQMRLFKRLKTTAQRTNEVLHELLLSRSQTKTCCNDEDELTQYVVLHDSDTLVEEDSEDLQELLVPNTRTDEDREVETPSESYPNIEFLNFAEIHGLDMEETTFVVSEEVFEKVQRDQKKRLIHVQSGKVDAGDVSDATGPCYVENNMIDSGEVLREGNENDSTPQSPSKCFVCAKEFADRQDFLAHRKQYHKGKYPCGECPKILQTSNALRVHARTHGGVALYNCFLCGKSFNQKVHYKYHMNRHNNVRQFECAHCQKSFLSKYDLSVHMRTHTRERSYCCEMCGKDFMLLQHLKMHIYSHQEKSFECQVCKRKFSSPGALRQHRLTIHENAPKFACELCDKRFRRRHHLLAHYKMHAKNTAAVPLVKPNLIQTGPDKVFQFDEDLHEDAIVEEVCTAHAAYEGESLRRIRYH